MKPSSQPRKLFLGLALSSTCFFGSLTSVLAKPTPSGTDSKTGLAQTVSFNLPPIPPGPPPGGRVRGGAKRGECPMVTPELTALVSFTKEGKELDTVTNVWGLTTLEQPTWWFFVPYTKNTGYSTTFKLQDENGNTLYKTADGDITLPDKPGIIPISLPANALGLELGKRYHWFLEVNCNQNQESLPIFVYVKGEIQRVSLSEEIKQNLKTATPLEQVTIYAQNGIWHEAVTTLATLRQQNPHNPAIGAQWNNLLASFQFGDVAAEPILSRKP